MKCALYTWSRCLHHLTIYDRPTQSIMYVPLQVNRSKKIILLIVQYKYLKSCSRRFYCPNLILRTRFCGTMFITEPSCLFDFHLTESVRWKWFVWAVYQFWKGISAGPALKYFTWFIGAGGSSHDVWEMTFHTIGLHDTFHFSLPPAPMNHVKMIFISTWQNLSGGNDVYWQCTSKK